MFRRLFIASISFVLLSGISLCSPQFELGLNIVSMDLGEINSVTMHQLFLDIKTPSELMSADFYIAMLDPKMNIYSAFLWTQGLAPSFRNLDVPGNLDLYGIHLLDFTIPGRKPSFFDPGIYTFAIAAAKPGTSDLISNVSTANLTSDTQYDCMVELHSDPSDSDEPPWFDGKIFTIIAIVANRSDRPLSGREVRFEAVGGSLYDFETAERYLLPAAVTTSVSGSALIFYQVEIEYDREYRWVYNEQTGEWEQEEVYIPIETDHYITASTDGCGVDVIWLD